MNQYIKLANELAIKGSNNKEGGPFGAIITDQTGTILAAGNNKVLIDHDPTAHAEIVAIREATKKLGTPNLSECILYTSCEPCPMCLSAIIWANIKEVYYACTRKDAAKIGFKDDAIYEYLKGNNKELIHLTQIDHDHCIRAFEDYANNEGEIY